MPDLFAPLTFARGPTWRNRLMLAPLTNCQSGADGVLSEAEFRWLTMRADGGFGLVMTCAAHVQRRGQGFPGQLGVWSDDHVPGLTRLAEAIRAQGAAEGIAFDFARIERRPDTLDSHRLIRWAAAQGLQDTIVERLFAAYFEEGRDIGDPAVLEFLAADAGMDSIQVAELLADDTDRAAVEREAKLASEMGITGVPTFIFANKFVLSGAREPEVLAQVIDKAVEAETEEPADSP